MRTVLDVLNISVKGAMYFGIGSFVLAFLLMTFESIFSVSVFSIKSFFYTAGLWSFGIYAILFVLGLNLNKRYPSYVSMYKCHECNYSWSDIIDSKESILHPWPSVERIKGYWDNLYPREASRSPLALTYGSQAKLSRCSSCRGPIVHLY